VTGNIPWIIIEQSPSFEPLNVMIQMFWYLSKDKSKTIDDDQNVMRLPGSQQQGLFRPFQLCNIVVPLFLCLPKDKSRTITMRFPFFLSLDWNKVNNRFFFVVPAVAQLLYGWLSIYPNTKSEQSKCNGISFYPEVARKSITRYFSSNKLLEIDVPLFLYLPKDKSRTITKQYDFFLSLDCQEVNNRLFFGMWAVAQLLHGCFLIYPNTKPEQSYCNAISCYPEIAKKWTAGFFHSPSTVPTLLYGCLSAYPNTKIGLSECYHIFYSVVSINTITQK